MDPSTYGRSTFSKLFPNSMSVLNGLIYIKCEVYIDQKFFLGQTMRLNKNKVTLLDHRRVRRI